MNDHKPTRLERVVFWCCIVLALAGAVMLNEMHKPDGYQCEVRK